MLQSEPYLAYLFFVMIAAGVIITYFYRKEIGFIITVIISVILAYVGIYSTILYTLSAICFVLLFLSLLGGGSITRPIRNLEGWIYLKRIARKNK